MSEYILVTPNGAYAVNDRIDASGHISSIAKLAGNYSIVLISRDGPTPDTTPPTILTGLAQTVAENQPFSLTLTANEAVTWAKVGGADAARFTLSGSTLSMSAKDYETPTDANGDNAYVVQITATDTAGNVSAPLTITVTVTDVFESVVPAPSTFPLATLVSVGAI